MGRRNRRKNKKRKEVQIMKSETLSLDEVQTKLVINKDVYQKVMFWVDKADTEVSGLGAIEIINGVPHVIDAILVEQECTGVETELNSEAICKALYAYEASRKPGEIRWWWHSHVNMEVFWSGTDYAAIEQLGRSGWFLSTVFNKKRELRTAFYGTSPMKIFIDSISTKIDQQIPQELLSAWSAEFTDKVKKPSATTYYLGGRDYSTPSHPITSQYEVEELDTQTDSGNLMFDDERFYLVTTGLMKEMIDEMDELRTHGWNDKEIASYYEIEDRLIDRYVVPDEREETQEIEELRRAGISESDIYEMMKIKRGGHSHAV